MAGNINVKVKLDANDSETTDAATTPTSSAAFLKYNINYAADNVIKINADNSITILPYAPIANNAPSVGNIDDWRP